MDQPIRWGPCSGLAECVCQHAVREDVSRLGAVHQSKPLFLEGSRGPSRVQMTIPPNGKKTRCPMTFSDTTIPFCTLSPRGSTVSPRPCQKPGAFTPSASSVGRATNCVRGNREFPIALSCRLRKPHCNCSGSRLEPGAGGRDRVLIGPAPAPHGWLCRLSPPAAPRSSNRKAPSSLIPALIHRRPGPSTSP